MYPLNSTTIYFDIYQLLNCILNLESHVSHGMKELDDLDELKIQVIDEKDNSIILSLTTYQETNGDLLPDPEIVVKVNLNKKFAEAISFQDQFGFRPIYFPDGKIDIDARVLLSGSEYTIIFG